MCFYIHYFHKTSGKQVIEGGIMQKNIQNQQQIEQQKMIHNHQQQQQMMQEQKLQQMILLQQRQQQEKDNFAVCFVCFLINKIS